jgi:hypothetical protein
VHRMAGDAMIRAILLGILSALAVAAAIMETA